LRDICESYQNPIDNLPKSRIFTKLVAVSPSIFFDPAPDLAAAILEAITNPSISFNQLAAAANTSPEALGLWMSRPDIRERIESTDRATTWRTRLVATAQLHAVPPALVKILQDYTKSRSPQPDAASTLIDSLDPDFRSSALHAFRSSLLDARRAETTRKSAALLVSISRQRPTAGPELPAHAPPAATPAQEPVAPAPTTNPQSETVAAAADIRNPKSLDGLLAQLAPHLQVIAEQLGIDQDEPAPKPGDAATTSLKPAASNSRTDLQPAPANHTRNRDPDRPTTHSRAPQRPGDRELATTGANEHWP
jgi:hypothetical protein